MAVKLNSFLIDLKLAWDFQNILDGGNVSDVRKVTFSDSLSNGDGIDLATHVFFDERTVAASATDNIDLAGSLKDTFGNTITFTKIKGLYVWNKSTTVGDIITLGGHATAAFINWVSDATDKVRVGPGGMIMLWLPSAAAYAVTATTGDLLSIIEVGTVNPVTYQIALVGVA